MVMAVIGFLGSKEIEKEYIEIIDKIVKEVEKNGDVVAVGDCEKGVDSIVTESSQKMYSLFYCFDDKDGIEAEADRAVRLIEASDNVVVFADRSCPPDCHPDEEFTGYSSIEIWGSAAYCIGRGKKANIIWCSDTNPILPEWSGGVWEEEEIYGFQSYRFIEKRNKSEQMKLF